MATVTPPSSRRLEQDHQRIRHPLDRLRKYINSYVALEAAALIGLLLAVAFWAGVVLDYGSFATVRLDWAQIIPRGVRAVLLSLFLLVALAFLLVLVLTRLFKEFRDAALALLLERRFPKVLGDRLITAVELASPHQAARYGYSAALVAETIHEAADRVEQVPVQEVFNWRRLKMLAVYLGVLTLGLYLLAAAGFCAVRAVKQEGEALVGVSDFHDVVGTWAERNLLMRNVLWPRRAHLEILPFYPDDPDREPRIARESPAPTLRVRAWKYVMADRDAEEGWRLLAWSDLEKDKSLAGGTDVPALPPGWKPRDPKAGFTVDEAELRLEAFPVRTSLPAGEKLPATYCTSNPDGSWRPLLWSDLTREKLDGLEVPALPGSWDTKARATQGVSGIALGGFGPLPAASRLVIGPKVISLSVDDVAATLTKLEKTGVPKGQGAEEEPNAKAGPVNRELLAAVRRILGHLDRLGDVQAALDRVEERAADRAMRRTMRKLIIPETVTLIYKGRKTTNTVTMARAAGNEFTGNFGDLKETVTYYVRGEDYTTPARRLVVVELPRLEKLESEEERPAYLYYRPSKDGTLAELRGQRQPFEPMAVSLSGDQSTLEVPSGTHLTLTATSSKPLEAVKITAQPKDQKNLRVGAVNLVDETTFSVRIPDVRREQRFSFEFKDTDGVVGRRGVLITPKDDVAPRIREFNPDEVIRKGKEGFLVAVGCRIPFKARIRDDHGLARVRYGVKVTPSDFLTEQKLYSLFGLGAQPLVGTPNTRLMGMGYLIALTKQLAATAGDEASEEQFIDLPAFTQLLATRQVNDGRNEVLERGTVLSLLASKQKDPFRRLLNEFPVTPDNWTANDEEGGTEPRRWVRAQDQRAPLGCDLPLWQLRYKGDPLKERDESKAQKRYIVEIRILVDDTYAEGEVDAKTRQPIPHISPSSETFTFVIVPENELLSRIAEEEDTKHRELLKLVKPLADNRDRLRDIVFAVSSPGVQQTELNAMIARCDTLDELLKTSHQDIKGIFATYERIVREMRVNQVRDDMTHKVYRDIYKPLYQVSEVQFDRTIASLRALRGALDNKEIPVTRRGDAARPRAQDARTQFNELVSQINNILDKMQTLSDINGLIKELVAIEQQEEKAEGLLRRVYSEQLKKRLQGKD
jgi:hypothetical protein